MKNGGFTLLEIIIVMAILGILLGMAAISGRDWLERCQVEGQTKELYAALMKARAGALQRNRVFFVDLQAANQYAIYEDTYSAATNTTTPDGDGSPQLLPGQDTLVVQKPTRFPIHPHLALGLTTFHFENNGLVSLNGSIVVDSSVEPVTDCIILFKTRIHMGKWDSAASKCIAPVHAI